MEKYPSLGCLMLTSKRVERFVLWWGEVFLSTYFSRHISVDLHREVVYALESSAVRARLPGLGFEPVLSSPAASATHFRSEGEKWTRVVRSAGIKLD
jgi:tripartite-type tricarboxylate transporter receptor subunit TctC